MKTVHVGFTVQVAEHDQDLIEKIPEIVEERFRGTAIRVDKSNFRFIEED